jgi:hypothetical protein
MLGNGNECGMTKSNENFKATIHRTEYDISKTSVECGIFKLFG